MTLIGPTLTPQTLVDDSHTGSKSSLLTHRQTSGAEGAAKQLVARGGGFSLHRLFAHRPLLQLTGAAGNGSISSDSAVLGLYFLVLAVAAVSVLVSITWKLSFSKKIKKTAAALHFNTISNGQEIFLHDNALFSQNTTTTSSPPTPIAEERAGGSKPAEEEPEPEEREKEEEMTLLTPPRLQETQPTLNTTPITITQFDTVHDDVDSTSPNNSTNTFSLGSRASLKLPSSHSPSARAPTHKTTIENDAFVHGEESDMYKTIDNTGIWEAAPIRIIEPTLATVLAVAGEEPTGEEDDNVMENEIKIASESKKKAHWKVEDLKKELQATQDIVAALKIELSKPR